MKNITKTILLVLCALSFNFSFSQEIETLLLAKNDAEKLTKAYFSPTFKGLIYSMNNGQYHTAKVHKKFGFDITIGANGAFVPSKDEIFNIAELGLPSNTTVTNGVNSTPTVAGSNSVDTAELEYKTTINGQDVEANFNLPGGIKEDLPLNAIPAPAVQIGIGLPYKLEAMVRFVPKIGPDDVKAGLFGFGLKKEITDWFGPIGKTPLHVSLLAAYSNMSVDYTIGNTTGDVSTQDAAVEFDLNTFTFQAIASLNFPIINVYGGVGYNTGNVKLNMLGDYTLTYDTNNPAIPTVSESITDPLSIKKSSGSFNTTIGARLSLGFFKIFGSYTLQEYNTLNAGIAFSFR